MPNVGHPRKWSLCSWLCCHCCGTCTDLRWAVYSFLSTLLAAAVLHHAFVTREQFYPAVVYLISSKVSVAVSAAWQDSH